VNFIREIGNFIPTGLGTLKHIYHRGASAFYQLNKSISFGSSNYEDYHT